eukprot:CAMPEP_0117505784 /NCGR_PEP_ID=MMETSP0784-20121206/25562_1 /TAXON_ID=39447 /ORGANISM="" /LENGTH=129 /DNA_ID=CAMNT_0005301219 /DNA_START=264 /DNA_END=650 /DNA_ORIENTATION=-
MKLARLSARSSEYVLPSLALALPKRSPATRISAAPSEDAGVAGGDAAASCGSDVGEALPDDAVGEKGLLSPLGVPTKLPADLFVRITIVALSLLALSGREAASFGDELERPNSDGRSMARRAYKNSENA